MLTAVAVLYFRHLKCFTKHDNAVIIFYLSVNLLTNVIVWLTAAEGDITLQHIARMSM